MNIVQRYNNIIDHFQQQSHRSRTVQKNIVGNAIIKGLSIILTLLIIPMTLGYVSEYDYGIWITLCSVIGWLTYFDIGVNNGLRNKLTEAINTGDMILARQYVSTTYAILLCIFVPVLFLFLIISGFIDWYSVFSIDRVQVQDLALLLIIIVAFVCIRSVLSTIIIILLAYQKTAQSGLISFVEQLASLIFIAVLVKFTEGSLFNLCFVFCAAPLLVLLIANLILFRGKFKEISPHIKCINWNLKNKLLGMGIKFFIIQIAGVIQFQTTSFIILKYFGTSDVTAYNIAFKYFNVLYMCWALTLSPLWNAVTEAKTQKDYRWVTNSVKAYQKLFALFLFGAVIMLVCSDFFYHIWLGDKITPIPFGLSCSICIYVITLTWGSLYVQILNGFGALKVQYIASVISPIVFLLVCYLLIKIFHLNVISVVIASIIANFNGIFLAPYQYYIFVSQKKPGSIWSKNE